eukprot:4490071-Prymnesium_polylepis.1
MHRARKGAAVRDSVQTRARCGPRAAEVPAREIMHDARVEEGTVHAETCVRRGAHVAHRLELVVHPRAVEGGLVRREVGDGPDERGRHLVFGGLLECGAGVPHKGQGCHVGRRAAKYGEG